MVVEPTPRKKTMFGKQQAILIPILFRLAALGEIRLASNNSGKSVLVQTHVALTTHAGPHAAHEPAAAQTATQKQRGMPSAAIAGLATHALTLVCDHTYNTTYAHST
jgi:hypothetical protein